MKKVTQSLLALLFAALPVTGFAAAADVLFSQKNSSNTAWANVIVAPTASSALAFNSSKVPISTQALTLLSVTAPAGIDLTLAGGSSGASLVLGAGSGVASLNRRIAITATDSTPPSSGTTVVGGARISSANNVALDFGVDGSASPFPGWIQVSDALNQATHYPLVLQGTGSNVLIGTTSETGLTGAGGLKINSSTAGAASAGALVVTGGLSAGNNGNASYFGGAVTAAVVTSTGAGYTNSGFQITNTSASRTFGLFLYNTSIFTIRDVTGAADLFAITTAGAATFGGAVTAGGTIKAGAGSGETLSAGSVDVAKDIGIASTQGIVQGGARIVTFTSGAATFAGAVTSTGTLTTSSGRVVATSIKTTTYTLATTDHVIVCNHASTPFTVTLIAASANTGRVFVVKNKGAATVTLSATSLGTIDGSNTRDLSTNQSLTLCSDGVQWNII
jgi:hypothetical protein